MADARPYERSGRYYDLIYADKDYAGEAGRLREVIARELPDATDLLDVACGTGRHVEQLARWYRVQGLDLDPELLQQATSRCPDATFHQAEMTSFELDACFDVVTCLFSAIGHLDGVEPMRRAVERMACHVRSPGLLIIEPWFTPETFWDDYLVTNVRHDSDPPLVWMYRQRREGRHSILEIHHLVAGPDQIEHFVERQRLALFDRDELTSALEAQGLIVSYVADERWTRGLYVARKP